MDSKIHFPWPSPLTARSVATAQAVRRELNCYNGKQYLLERRPKEQGRTVLLEIQLGSVRELLPSGCSVRCRIHEYGGGSYLVGNSGIFFVEESDQQIYRLGDKGVVHQLTHEKNARFGDFCEHPSEQSLICVRELHENGEVINELVVVSLHDGKVVVLVTGDDFYASPCVSPDAKELTYISWCHPHMPWHENKLWRQQLSDQLEPADYPEAVGGSSSSKSQPCWAADGSLYFLDDVSGWWNIWRQGALGSESEAIAPIKADLCRAQWELGSSSYQVSSNGSILALASRQGYDRLLSLSPDASVWQDMQVAQTQLACLKEGADGQCCFIASGPRSTAEVLQVGSQSIQSLLSPNPLEIQDSYISIGESKVFTARDGTQAQGFFYAPCNPLAAAPADLPPLIVVMHGGPTTACGNSFNSLIQFWTSRGVAVFDINYRGSTGFGRDYRLALHESWGIADVQDCVDGVEELVKQRLVDYRRVAIRGGSAGGFTALAAAVGSDVFAAVGCHYGIGDLELLASETHKFESHYLEHLIGSYPQQKDRYVERSPIHQLDMIQCPVFISHGLLDHVVPVNQAQRMAEALTERGVEVEVLLFDDERHGYAQEANIAKQLQREFDFFKRAFERSTRVNHSNFRPKTK